MTIRVDSSRAAMEALSCDIGRVLASLPMRLSACDSGYDLEIFGHRMLADPAVLKVRSFLGLKTRIKVYEETTTALLSHLITRLNPRHFFDIGAGSGYFSRVAASHIGSPPHVHAFEMRPDQFGSLQRHLAGTAAARRVCAHHAAMSDRHRGVTEAWMSRSFLFERRPDLSEYQEAWHRRVKFRLQRNNSRGLVSARVLITSLDHFVATRRVVPDLIKIDVDGYEMNVLAGAAGTLARHRPAIILELHTERKLRFGATRRRVVGYLQALGYEALLLTDHHDRHACEVLRVTASSPILSRQETDLLLFVHPDARVSAGEGSMAQPREHLCAVA